MDKENIPDRIKKRRLALNMTQEALAKKVGVSKVYIYKIEKQHQPPSSDTAKKIAKALRDDPLPYLEWLVEVSMGTDALKILRGDLEKAGVKTSDIDHAKMRPIPVINNAECGELIDSGDLEYPPGEAKDYELFFSKDPNAYFVTAKGESMIGAGIFEGSLLLVSPNSQVENGNIVVARTDEGVTVKIFVKRETTINGDE